jgi:spermidine synthase
MKFARALLIFSYGLFSIAAQALLFREFLTTFEGNDISVGIFFASWFLWVGIGATFVYRAKGFAEKLLANIELLFLGYLPAFALQVLLIIQAREIAGVEAYVLLLIKTIVLLSLVINAPVSIITGMFFPLACRWVRRRTDFAVSHVYILEAAGSFAGGLGVTLLLALGVSSAKIFLLLAFIVSLSASIAALVELEQVGKGALRWPVETKASVLTLIPVFFLLCLALRADRSLTRYVQVAKWSKLLPADAFEGSFRTAQAEYLYGLYQGQWIAVREGSTCEVLPDEASAGRIAAIGLCQNPVARKVLVIGSGLAVCRELLKLPQIELVTWTHCDGEYVEGVESFVPDAFRIDDRRCEKYAGDIRPLLNERKSYYGLIILNLPDATSSVLNRYYTRELYGAVRDSLEKGGIFAVRTSAGENIMGTELINLGASTKLTLEKVFSKFVLVPGEDSWFVVSDSQDITGDPGTLRDRFASVQGAANVFPPDALLSVYLPDRAESALQAYGTADLPERLLVNTDSRPLTHFYSLLLAAKQSGAALTRFFKSLALSGWPAFVVPILILIVLRIVYVLKTQGEGPASGFDSAFLVFSAGWVGIAAVIVLMYLYQTQFGSLYLYIGVISSLFMVGLTLGATLIKSVLRKGGKTRLVTCLITVIFGHGLLLSGIAFLPDVLWSQPYFAAAFVLCGLCTGCYFPLAAKRLALGGFESGQAGSMLETADHLGASAGGIVTSLALVPVLGTGLTLFTLVLLVLANVPGSLLAVRRTQLLVAPRSIGFRLRRIGYALFGIAVSLVIGSNLLSASAAPLSPSLPQYTVHALAGENQLRRNSALVADKSVNYFAVFDANEQPVGYIFSSADFAPEVRGFGGRINLGIYTDTAGELIDFHIIRSNETPSYLALLNDWPEALKGRGLFRSDSFADVDTVTGATVSCQAIMSALRNSGQRFTAEVLGKSVQAGSTLVKPRTVVLADAKSVFLIVSFILTLIVAYGGGFWSRLAVLCFNLVVCGIVLNAQYSTEQIVTILSLQAPQAALSVPFLLAVALPVLVVLFGNIYCGYICPFGVAQELLGFLIPARFRPVLSTDQMKIPRFVKYVVLFVFVTVFFLTRNRATLASDPLISVFSSGFWSSDWRSVTLLIVGLALAGSLLYTRFWCRYLCPAGGFLALLNGAAPLKRYLPSKRFGRCEFGVTAGDRMDCIQCDKCRYEHKPAARPGPELAKTRPYANALARLLIISVLAGSLLILAVPVRRLALISPSALDRPATVSGGQPRDVDLQRVRKMIRQKQLADKEAEYYRQVE